VNAKDSIENIISYFRACYQADQREQNIWNIFDKSKLEHLHFFSGEEQILTAQIPFRFVDSDLAEQILKTLEIYKKEKQLYYFAFFIGGQSKHEALKGKKLMSPLIYYPAEIFINSDGNYCFKIDFNKQYINYNLISVLNNVENGGYEKALFDALPQKEISYPEFQKLIASLQLFLTEINYTQAYRYPEQLLDSLELNSFFNKSELMLLPATCLGVMTSSKSTRGILNELAIIAERAHPPLSLQQLFSINEPLIKNSQKERKLYFEPLLSSSQKKAIQTAFHETLSVIIGPPGTGKSYTIAALALESLQAGKSILIASKNALAVDVVEEKISAILGDNSLMVRGGNKEYLSQLKKFLENILNGAGVTKFHEIDDLDSKITRLEKLVQTLVLKQTRLQKTLTNSFNWHIKTANYLLKTKDKELGIFQRYYFYLKEKYIKHQIQKHDNLWVCLQELEEVTSIYLQKFVELMQLKKQKELHQLLYQNRPMISQFLKALRARRDSKQEEFLNKIDFNLILKAFPIWLININDIYDILPLEKELFDIAIIDEASQCDIPSAIPILYRAKNVVIVGDHKQLRHVSFLSNIKQEKLQSDFTLPNHLINKYNYRDDSILDIVQNYLPKQSQLHFLNEHFRSHPNIIHFSNKYFYGGSLRIMTQKPYDESDSILTININGSRDSKGVNQEESKYIIQKIREIIYSEKDASIFSSTGVLSPFRDQVDYISQEVSKSFSLDEIRQHGIEVGTAHSFQGNEKDIMFISWVLDKKSHIASFNYLNKEDIFNVAITRARKKQFLVVSFDISEISEKHILRQYIKSISNATILSDSSVLSQEMHWTNELTSYFKEKNVPLLENIEIAGILLRCLIPIQNSYYGIYILEGYSDSVKIQEYLQILKRANISIIPLSYTTWAYCRDNFLRYIHSILQISVNNS